MNKPLGYYCAVTPGDGSFLDELQTEYGSNFERLTRLQKMNILVQLIMNLRKIHVYVLGQDIAEEQNEQMEKMTLLHAINSRLPEKDYLNLAEFLLTQLKYSDE